MTVWIALSETFFIRWGYQYCQSFVLFLFLGKFYFYSIDISENSTFFLSWLGLFTFNPPRAFIFSNYNLPNTPRYFCVLLRLENCVFVVSCDLSLRFSIYLAVAIILVPWAYYNSSDLSIYLQRGLIVLCLLLHLYYEYFENEILDHVSQAIWNSKFFVLG